MAGFSVTPMNVLEGAFWTLPLAFGLVMCILLTCTLIIFVAVRVVLKGKFQRQMEHTSSKAGKEARDRLLCLRRTTFSRPSGVLKKRVSIRGESFITPHSTTTDEEMDYLAADTSHFTPLELLDHLYALLDAAHQSLTKIMCPVYVERIAVIVATVIAAQETVTMINPTKIGGISATGASKMRRLDKVLQTLLKVTARYHNNNKRSSWLFRRSRVIFGSQTIFIVWADLQRDVATVTHALGWHLGQRASAILLQSTVDTAIIEQLVPADSVSRFDGDDRTEVMPPSDGTISQAEVSVDLVTDGGDDALSDGGEVGDSNDDDEEGDDTSESDVPCPLPTFTVDLGTGMNDDNVYSEVYAAINSNVKCVQSAFDAFAKALPPSDTRPVDTPLDGMGNTALHLACEAGNKSVTRCLIKHLRADTALKNSFGLSPLAVAGLNNHTRIVRKLVIYSHWVASRPMDEIVHLTATTKVHSDEMV